MKNERNSGFELLRLLCIYGILAMHVFGNISAELPLYNTAAHVLVNTAGNAGVTCFLLISGYFGIRFDLKKLIRLDLMVIFFTVLGTVCVGGFGIKALIKACIPVVSRQYWFITCYFALCILSPFLNQIPERLSKAGFRRLLLVLLFLFSVLPTLTTYDIMQDAGKGLVHFVMIYLLGRYLRLYCGEKRCAGRRLGLGAALSFGAIFFLDGALTLLHGGLVYSTFSRDCSLFVIAASVFVFLLFSKADFTNRLINRAAGDVLAVYVLDGFLRTLCGRVFDLNTYSGAWYLLPAVLAYAAFLMASGILLNEARRLTVGRAEPWLCESLAGLLHKIWAALVSVLRKVEQFFFPGC